MNDIELADRIVAVGVGGHVIQTGSEPLDYYVVHSSYIGLTAESFVRDPRVAMALMEKCRDKVYTISMAVVGKADTEVEVCEYSAQLREHRQLGISQNESLPRAITEACVEALTSSDGDNPDDN